MENFDLLEGRYSARLETVLQSRFRKSDPHSVLGRIRASVLQRMGEDEAFFQAKTLFIRPRDAIPVGATVRDEGIFGRMEAVVSRISQLPTLPSIAHELQQLVARESSSAKDIEKVIQKEQVLAARILKLSNSAYFGLSRQVSDISQAVTVLGTRRLHDLVMASFVFSQLSSPPSKSLDYVHLWEHALATACATESVAEHFRLERDKAFMAGLLHDIGKLVLSIYFPREYDETLRASVRDRAPLVRVEEERLGITHAEVGYMLLAKWKLPEAYAYSTKYHHQAAPSSPHRDLAGMVHVGDILAKAFGVGFGGCFYLETFDERVLQRFDLTEAALAPIVQKTAERLKAADSFFELIRQSAPKS